MSEVSTLHVPFGSFLRSAGIPYTYHNPTRPTGATLGDADYLIHWQGRCLHIEFKDKDTKVSATQERRHAELMRAGCRVFICRTLNDAIELTKAWKSGMEIKADSPHRTRPVIRAIGTHGDYVCFPDGTRRRATIQDLSMYQRENI